MVGRNRSSDLPPGFRFHPTDEELIMFYLRNQATSKPCPVSIIPEVDIYKFDPWELPEKTEFGENEWYFFTPRDRKYPNGVRPNRAAVSGYWKATGTDKSIYSGTKYVGVKKALVFYKGRPPKGIKTDWIMHEYRLIESCSRQSTTTRQNGSMRLDDWVLCRIYKKKNLGKNLDVIKAEEQQSGEVYDHHHDQMVMSAAGEDENGVVQQFPRPCSLSHLWELEYMGSSISQIFGSENIYSNYSYDINNQQSMMMSAANHNNINNGSNVIIPRQLGEVGNNHHQHHHNQYSDAMKFPVFEF